MRYGELAGAPVRNFVDTMVNYVWNAQALDGVGLTLAKMKTVADAVYANDNQRTMAQWYGASLATGATVEEVRTWPDRIRIVTAEAVRDAARRWFDKRRSVTGYLVKETRPEDKRS